MLQHAEVLTAAQDSWIMMKKALIDSKKLLPSFLTPTTETRSSRIMIEDKFQFASNPQMWINDTLDYHDTLHVQ